MAQTLFFAQDKEMLAARLLLMGNILCGPSKKTHGMLDNDLLIAPEWYTVRGDSFCTANLNILS